MECETESECYAALLGAIAAAVDMPTEQIRVPARKHAAGCYAPHAPLPTPSAFGALYGVPLISAVERENDWLLLTLTDAFYTACVDTVRAALPPAEDTRGVHALDRMLHLARHGGEGCPAVPSMQRALLFAICAHRSRQDFLRACFHLESIFSCIPPRERPALISVSGAYGDACARLIAQAYATMQQR